MSRSHTVKDPEDKRRWEERKKDQEEVEKDMLKEATNFAKSEVAKQLENYLAFTKNKSVFVPEIKSADEENPFDFKKTIN